MKHYHYILAALIILVACTPKDLNNNSHTVSPIYEESADIQKKDIKSLQEAENITAQMRPLIKSGDTNKMIQALKALAAYALNMDNLNNPEIHFEGHLAPEYRKLIDLYGYGLALGIKDDIQDEKFKKLLLDYRATIFYSCNKDNRECRQAVPFKGPYGVSILTHLLTEDIDKLEKLGKAPDEQTLKNTIFSLYVLRNFKEAYSSVSGNLFIRFASVYFRYIKENKISLRSIEDDLMKSYLIDLQNQMVKQSTQEVNASSCAIFDTVDPLQVNEISSSLDKDLVTQLSNHFFKCNTPEEIKRRLVEIEQTKKDKAIKIIKAEGPWSRMRNDFHSRSYIIREKVPKVLRSFDIKKEIPLEKVYFLDRLFYGKMTASEKATAYNRMSQEDLVELIAHIEQYATENFLYSMHYTFGVYNRSIEEFKELHGSINSDFVQNVYDTLFSLTSETWVDYKTNVGQLRVALTDISTLLSPENREATKEKLENLRNNKIDKKSTIELINLSVTYPIVLATRYFAGENGGGTMKIRFTWLDWLDNSLDFPTAEPLRHYFLAYSRDSLQLLDFGSRNYQPGQFERVLGLATALKTGFFEVVNFDIGKPNKGTINNISLFFKRYIENNNEQSEAAKKSLSTYQTKKENDWPKFLSFCEKPIWSRRLVTMTDITKDVFLKAKDPAKTDSKSILDDISMVYSLSNPIKQLNEKNNYFKRIYQVIDNTLNEMKTNSLPFKESAFHEMKPSINLLRLFLSNRQKHIDELNVEGQNCFLRLERMQRFQQNILQLNTIEYLARVHAGMTLIKNSELSNEASVDEVKSYITSDTKSSIGAIDLKRELLESSVLRTVNSQLGLTGTRLLQEAINLVLIPHNYNGDFGYPISDMEIMSNDLSDSNTTLARIGKVTDAYFEVNEQDQKFRVREELLGMSVTAGELRSYFKPFGHTFSEIPDNLPDDAVVRLNPRLTVKIQNLKFYKDKLGSSSTTNFKVFYKENMQDFVKEGIEKIFGTNTTSRLFHYSNGEPGEEYFYDNWRKNLETFNAGPIYVPEKLEQPILKNKVLCALNMPFDARGDYSGCLKFEVNAKDIVDDFVTTTEFFYLEDWELQPLTTMTGDLRNLIDNTYFASKYIDNYDAGTIKQFYEYYKYEEKPELWTWFDQFMADNFTTQTKGTVGTPLSNPGHIPYTVKYELFYDDVLTSRFDKKLISIPSSPRDVLRNFYRAKIMNHVANTQNIIESIIDREHSTMATEYPFIALRKRDLKNIQVSGLWDWVPLEMIGEDSQPLALLKKHGYEISNFETTQITSFREYKCSLLPEKGDIDFNSSINTYIEGAGKLCPLKVHRWMRAKKCQVEKARKNRIKGYKYDACPEELEGL